MTGDVSDLFESAANYVAKLAAVNHAFIVDDQDEMLYLLDDVDIIDARHVANQLRNLVAGLRGVSIDADTPSAPTAIGDSGSFPLSVAPDPDGKQASAPVQFSVKVPPCE